jgi:hypothetical protein
MSLRYTLVGGMLLLGLLLAAQALLSTPMVTVEECTATGVAEATTPSSTPDCVRYTERAWGQQLYLFVLGLGIAGLGVGLVVVDRRLVRR